MSYTPKIVAGLALLLGVGVAYAATRRREPAANGGDPVAADGADSFALDGWAWPLPDLGLTFEPDAPAPMATDPTDGDANTRAFLLMIRKAEGTADANGYRALFGHRANAPKLFDSYADHPRQVFRFTDKNGRQLWTSAAGAYQAMAVSPIPGGGSTRVDTWDRIKRRLSLPDFSPESQDRFAVELLRESGALALIRVGRFTEAVQKAAPTWASLPGANYGQPERALSDLAQAFTAAGGVIAA